MLCTEHGDATFAGSRYVTVEPKHDRCRAGLPRGWRTHGLGSPDVARDGRLTGAAGDLLQRIEFRSALQSLVSSRTCLTILHAVRHTHATQMNAQFERSAPDVMDAF
jgi:hypothetical protein